MLDPNYLCTGCMKPRKTLEGACPYCGFDEKEYRKTASTRALHLRTVLAGKYMTGKVLGEGGFGITYLGWDLNLEIPVAVKEYFPVGLASRGTVDGWTERLSVISDEKGKHFEYGQKSFVKEARNLAQFQNVPGIVSVKDLFFENGTAYMAMEYLKGKNLKEYLKSREQGCVSEEEMLKIMHPVIDALSVVHSTGMIHRDISPENIILTENGKVKLIDFGAARIATGTETQSLTVLLKHGYAPVEQYQTRGKQGAWTDIYAICATMYRMLSGKTPEPSIDRMLEDKVESLYEISRKDMGIKVSRHVSDIIQKGMSVKAENRWQRVDELAEGLFEQKETVQEKDSAAENLPGQKEIVQKKDVAEDEENQDAEVANMVAAESVRDRINVILIAVVFIIIFWLGLIFGGCI